MRYFKLVDRYNWGVLIRTEGRKQGIYVYGESIWQKTGILALYLMEKTGLYDKYEEITEEQAYEIIEQTQVMYHRLEKICIDRLKKLSGLIPDMQTKDLEIKIIYLLYCISKIEKIDVNEWKNYGFTPRMLETLQVLIDNGNMENDLQMENILEDTLAMLAKSEDILQNGPKNERDKKIMEQKVKHDNLVRETV